jgi:hypothetical protein
MAASCELGTVLIDFLFRLMIGSIQIMEILSDHQEHNALSSTIYRACGIASGGRRPTIIPFLMGRAQIKLTLSFVSSYH